MLIYNIIKNTALFMATKFHKVSYHNLENIPKDKGYILCANHRSNWDAILILKPFKKKIYFMAKEEMFKYPIFRSVLRHVGAFPVARGKGDMSAITTSMDLIEKNEVVTIFPEGTRSKTGEFLRPKAGAALVASKTGADVLPVRILYHEPKRFRSRVDVIFGEIIEHSHLNISDGSLKDVKAASLLIMDHIKMLEVK